MHFYLGGIFLHILELSLSNVSKQRQCHEPACGLRSQRQFLLYLKKIETYG